MELLACQVPVDWRNAREVGTRCVCPTALPAARVIFAGLTLPPPPGTACAGRNSIGMRISVRLIISLVAAATVISVLFAAYQVESESGNKRADRDGRARILAENLREAIELLPPAGSEQKLRRIVERFGNRDFLAGIAIYRADGKPVLTTPDLDRVFPAGLPAL